MSAEPQSPPSRYLTFDRAAWAKLRDSTPLTLSEADVAELRGLNDALSIAEVEQIYLPLSRLLSLYVRATQELHRASQTFLGDRTVRRGSQLGAALTEGVGQERMVTPLSTPVVPRHCQRPPIVCSRGLRTSRGAAAALCCVATDAR